MEEQRLNFQKKVYTSQNLIRPTNVYFSKFPCRIAIKVLKMFLPDKILL